MENPIISVINPLEHSEISSIALKMYSHEHKDLFDCVISGTAFYQQVILVTEHKELSILFGNTYEFQNLQLPSWDKFARSL
jgi:hypothetical protein